MARERLMEIGPARAIQPQAAPVNTYVRPADPAPSPLHDLANGLADLGSGLGAFMQERKDQAKQGDILKGQAAFDSGNQEAWGEAVRTGKVPPYASKHFMEGYKKEQGNLLGIQLRTKFNQAYLGWEGRDKNDPAAFQEFVTKFMADNIPQEYLNDPDVLRGLNPHLGALNQDSYTVWSEERAKSVYNGSIDARTGVVAGTIDSALQQGTASGTTDYGGLFQDIQQGRADAVASGIRGEDYDKKLANIIITKAIEHGDPELLKLLDKPLADGETPLSQTAEVLRSRNEAEDKIESDKVYRANAERTAADREARARVEAGKATINKILTLDPTAEIPEDIIREIEKNGEGDIRSQIEQRRKTFMDSKGLENPQDMLEIERGIQQGEYTADDALRDPRIRSKESYAHVLERIEKRNKAMRDGTGILADSTAKRYKDTIRERTAASDWATGGFDPGGLTDDGLEATRDFERMLIEWDDKNPNATLVERQKAINEIGDMVLKHITPIDPQTGQEGNNLGYYETQQQAQGRRAEPGVEQRRGQALGDMPQEQGLWDQFNGDNPPTADQLPDQVRIRLEQDAIRNNMTTEEYMKNIWEEMRKLVNPKKDQAPPQTPEVPAQQPAAEVPQQQGQADTAGPMPFTEEPKNTATKALDELTTGAPQQVASGDGPPNEWSPKSQFRATATAGKAASMLNLIGRSEGTDKARGYNETLGYGAYTSGNVELVGMTLDQIDALQTKMLKHPGNKWNSSALGRYQIVRTTLRKLRKELGLKGTEKFDAAMQDRLAVQLLKGRGLDAWASGKISDKQFLANLANEWASLPKPSGKGAYKGQNASVSPAMVLAAVKHVRDVA